MFLITIHCVPFLINLVPDRLVAFCALHVSLAPNFRVRVETISRSG